MDIKRATEQALHRGCWMTRPEFHGVAVEPSNTARCCILHKAGRAPGPRWQPDAEDLTADDWELLEKWEEPIITYAHEKVAVTQIPRALLPEKKTFRERHPDFPLWLSIIALVAAIATPILRGFLAGMT